VRLVRLHPEVAFRSCEDCLKHVYDEQTGRRAEYPPQSGRPIPRAAGNEPPCRRGPDKCPKGHPAAGRELTEVNWQAYMHYLECKATGNFPADPIVSRNAGVIRGVEDALDRAEQELARRYLSGRGGLGRGY
jgi:hypothetical protein